MRPDTHTVQQLFERDVRYTVPLYQRPYVWDAEHQWEPLWDDILTLLEHQEANDTVGLWSHFLGAVVFEQGPPAPGRIPTFTIIDGQQRLTTLQLLVAAASIEMAAVGAEDDAGLLRKLVENDPRRASGEELLKVWPTNANRRAFAAVMEAGGPPPGHVDDPHNRIDEAIAYFRDRSAEYLRGGTESGNGTTETDVAQRAARLRITIGELLKVVSITLEADDNAQVIFETLNARGTPLLALDLVKNAVFHHAARQQRDTDALYEHVWRPVLDGDHWRQERRQGRLNRPIGELFLMHWLTMRLDRIIPATELFATFRQRILPNSDAESLIRELVSDAKTLRAFDHHPVGSPEATFFTRLAALDAGTVLPIALLLFRSGTVTQDRRRRCLRILESWLARRALMRWTAKNYNRLVPRLIARMKADLGRCDEILFEALAGGEGEISRWPTDQEFIEFLTNRDMYGTVSRSRLAMALAAVEASLRSDMSEIHTVASALTIEHLMPQEWETHWQLTDLTGVPLQGEPRERAVAERAARLHRLGNLTIVTGSLNSAASNAPWATKRNTLNEHTVLLLNARVARRERWDEQAIDEHGRWLAERLAAIWPGPDPTSWL